MSDRERYAQLIGEEPDLFASTPTDGIRILRDPARSRAAEQAAADRLRRGGYPKHWSSVGVLSEDEYFLLLRDAVEFADRSLGTYLRLVPRPRGSMGAAVLCTSPRGVTLVRVFRHATRSWCLEVPRGFGDVGEASEQTARREAEEETGLLVRPPLRELGLLHPNTGILGETVALFHAELTDMPTGSAPEHEVVETSIAEFEAWLRDGRINDAFSLAAFTRARLRGIV